MTDSLQFSVSHGKKFNVKVLGAVGASLLQRIHSVAAEVEEAGGQALAVACDVRRDEELQSAVEATVQRFGGIDVLVNNAGAIQLSGTLDTRMRSYDRMFAVNARAAFHASQLCLPHLLEATNPHILNISPPLDMHPKWFAAHAAYSLSKYGMSVWVIGMAAELAEPGVAVNGLWPRTTIATAAVRNLLGGDPMIRRSRHPSIMGDAAHAILIRDSRACSGQLYLDEEVLRAEGVTDFEPYAVEPGTELQLDLFVEGGPEGLQT